MAINYAASYRKEVDERFYRASQAVLALNNDYKFTGEKTVKVYSLPTVPMVNYTRSGTNRYGNPADLQDNVQELTVTQDRAFTFVIDKGDKIQTRMAHDAGKSLTRQIREVVVPEYDHYVFDKLARTAQTKGNTSHANVTKNNAYEEFLAAQEALGDANVPDSGRVCFCSYKFANLLKQDSAFMLASERSRQALERGIIGEVDGVKIVRVPKNRLAYNSSTSNGTTNYTYCTDFILTHPIAATAPKQLEDYKIHDNPPGISGWLVEGRILYDCFILNNKADAVFYHGATLT